MIVHALERKPATPPAGVRSPVSPGVDFVIHFNSGATSLNRSPVLELPLVEKGRKAPYLKKKTQKTTTTKKQGQTSRGAFDICIAFKIADGHSDTQTDNSIR